MKTKVKATQTYWFVGYQYNRVASYGFGRCFVTNLSSLPELESSLAKENYFTNCSVLSMTPLTKKQYMAFKKKGFK